MLHDFKITGAVNICLFLIFVFSACSEKEQPLEEVNYRLKWLFNISVVGDLWADAHGHFERNGLNVTVKPGGPEKDAIKELEIGHAQFGVASADQVIRAVAKGSPIVVLAQLFQINPLALDLPAGSDGAENTPGSQRQDHRRHLRRQ